MTGSLPHALSAQACPVCQGCGTVPPDFYLRLGASIAREQCRTCKGVGVWPPASAGSQEPAPAEPTEKARTGDGLSVADQLEPAPAERDERTWLIRKAVVGPHDTVGASIIGPVTLAVVEVKPASELARVQEQLDLTDWWLNEKEKLAQRIATRALEETQSLQAQLDQAREALKEIASAGERVPDWRSMADCARAALASGVTEKGDEADE